MRIVKRAELTFGHLPGRRSADPLAGLADGREPGPLSIRIAHLTAGPRAPHRHPGSIEVIYVVEGEGTHWQEGETVRVEPGDVVLVPVGVAHATLPDSEMLLYCVFPVGSLEGNVEELDTPIEL
jgi:mannose-6-phosphate isomerase-like protein (cupin superfamily)